LEFFQTSDPEFPAITAHRLALRGESVSCEQDRAGCFYHLRVDPLQDERGQIAGCIGCAQKVSERRAYERALRKAQDELERRSADRAARLAKANEHLRQQIKERRHAERLLQKEQRYLRHMLELQDRDRQLIAYEIHDGLVQQLAAAIMRFEIISQVTEDKSAEARKTLASGVEMLGQCMREARRLIGGLRSPALDEFGVVAAIEELACQGDAADKPEIEFVHHLDCQRLEPSLENAIFRIVQESLTNARRHSRSERLLLRLIQRDGHIRIEVQDWGVGFNARNVGDGHFGLEGIQERARLFGGSAAVKSAPGKGTRIVVELPVGDDACKLDETELVPRSAPVRKVSMNHRSGRRFQPRAESLSK
jgi:signal transduction histidine kinase